MELLIWGALLVYSLVAFGIYKLVQKKTINKWISRGVLAFFVLLPTYDIIITNTLGVYYCLSAPNPKTYIKQTIEKPLSIYWEDNVYPGFSIEDRKLMIMNYLDGKHLQTMTLNGDDGKIYMYEAQEGGFDSLQYDKKYKDKYTQYVSIIMQSEKVYTKETMPKMNYTVTFDEVKLNAFSRKFLYSDETKVIDNQTGETIAYNRRYMRFYYNIFPDIALGNIYYYGRAVCGERVSHLEYKVFDAYKWSNIHLGSHQRNLHEILIKRNKGEK